MKKVQELVSITYAKSANILIVKGHFFQAHDLDTKCIDIISDHLAHHYRLTIYIKAELIDLITYKSLKRLIVLLNNQSNKADITVKWYSVSESLPMGKSLSALARFPFEVSME